MSPRGKCKDEYTYTKINKLAPGMSRINLYGVLDVVDKELTQMQTGKYNGRIRIRDETCAPGESFLIHFFIPSCSNFPLLEKGAIIRLHRVKIETFNDIVDGRVFSSNDLAVFPRVPDKHIDTTAGSIQFTANDKARLVELRNWISTWWDTPTLTVTADNKIKLGGHSTENTRNSTSPGKKDGVHNGAGNTTKLTLPSKKKKMNEIDHQKSNGSIVINVSSEKEAKELPKKPDDDRLESKTVNVASQKKVTFALNPKLRHFRGNKRLNPAFLNSSSSSVEQELLKACNLVEKAYKTHSVTKEAPSTKIDSITGKRCPQSGDIDSDSSLTKRLFIVLERCSSQPSPKRPKTSHSEDKCITVQDDQVSGLIESEARSLIANVVPECSSTSFTKSTFSETKACSDENREKSVESLGCSLFCKSSPPSHATRKKKTKPSDLRMNPGKKNPRDDQLPCPGQSCASGTCDSESHLESGPVLTNKEEDDGNDSDETIFEEPKLSSDEFSSPFQYLPFNSNVEAKPASLKMFEDFSWPLYRVNVRFLETKPTLNALKTDGPKDLISGLCKKCWHCIRYSQLCWKQSQPGCKMPLCPYCMQAGVENFVSLDFRVKFIVKDAWGTTLKIVATRKDAAEFLGCSVIQYQMNPILREATVQKLESVTSGRFFNICIKKIFTQVECQYHISKTSLDSLLQS